MGIVANRRDGKVDFIGMCERAGSDRVEPDRQFAENPSERIGRNPVRREIYQRIDDLPTVNILFELVARTSR